MTYFILYAIAGLVYFWLMVVSWSVSAGPSSIGTVIGMLIASVLAATSGIWLFNKKAGATLTVALMAFFVIWPPIAFAVHGLGIGDAVFYAVVLALFVVPARILLRREEAVSRPLVKGRTVRYTLASLIPLALAGLLSWGLWGMVLSPEFWQNLSSQPDIWGLRAR